MHFFFFLLPVALAAQTKSDYERTMAKFQQFYNAGRSDSINAMFAYQRADTRPFWTNEGNESLLKEPGTLKSFKFIGIDTSDPDSVYVFKTVFSKAGAKTTSLTLDKNNCLGDFRFITRSDGITQLLRKDKSK